VVAELGTERIDILVNNAGGNFAPEAAQDLAGIRQTWLDNIEGNILPTVLLTHALLPLMARPGGRVIAVTSIAAFRGPATYGGSKAALHPWIAELSVQLAPEGITVNAVAPAGATRMTAALFERSGEAPPPEADPSLNAPLVAFLASERASHVNGQILGRTDFAYTIFQHPKQIAFMWRDGGWTPEAVAEHFDQVLGQHLQHVGMVMPSGMEYSGDKK
jgi:3-oxoacyl-[acyl-carrier protein] reductase